MDKSNDDPFSVSQSSKSSLFEALLAVVRMTLQQQFGTYEEDKAYTTDEEKERYPRIFGDKVPRKKRCHRSRHQAMKTIWTRVIQNPNAESEPSPSSCVTQTKPFKKRKIVRCLEVEPTRTTPPEWLLNVMMREGNGYDAKLILSTKKLYTSDLDKIQGRLCVPFNQVTSRDFLTEEETRIINEQGMKISKEGVSVDLVDPMLNKHVVNLRKRKIGRLWYYVFVGGWNDVVAANRFKVDDVFPLWSFRSGRDGKLCFALVPPSSHRGGSTSGESRNRNPLPGDSCVTYEARRPPILYQYQRRKKRMLV